MIGARRRTLLTFLAAALALALAVAVAVVLFDRRYSALAPRPPAERPALLLLTSLPLLFGEDFSLQGGGSPAVRKLQTRYRIVPISATDSAELKKARLLLMAHAPSQTAEGLVALDQWVRAGGRLLLLADPMLEWPSKRPLGDPLRPPAMFMDTGLLAHWGLRLDAPAERGPAMRKLGVYAVMTVSPGALAGRCKISSDALVAHCPIGEGEATIVADADLLDVDQLGPAAEQNLDGLLFELDRLERK
jgi:hypothetical protein